MAWAPPPISAAREDCPVCGGKQTLVVTEALTSHQRYCTACDQVDDVVPKPPTDDVRTWPVLDRPAVWVNVAGVRHPGREHARHADQRLVAWGSNYRWLSASQVTDRDDQPE